MPGLPPLAVDVVPSARAKRLSLRVSRADGSVRLSLPKTATLKMAEDFVAEKAAWIRKHSAAAPTLEPVGFGTQLPMRGQIMEVVPGKGRRAVVSDGVIVCPGQSHMVGPRVAALLKLEARAELKAATDKYAAMLGKSPNRISLKDTRSRWGSCSSQGNLNYSWRLIMAPPAVLDYVAAHEVAHLAVMDHSPRFWKTVRDMCPGFEAQKTWLRRQGGTLHSFDFNTA